MTTRGPDSASGAAGVGDPPGDRMLCPSNLPDHRGEPMIGQPAGNPAGSLWALGVSAARVPAGV